MHLLPCLFLFQFCTITRAFFTLKLVIIQSVFLPSISFFSSYFCIFHFRIPSSASDSCFLRWCFSSSLCLSSLRFYFLFSSLCRFSHVFRDIIYEHCCNFSSELQFVSSFNTSFTFSIITTAWKFPLTCSDTRCFFPLLSDGIRISLCCFFFHPLPSFLIFFILLLFSSSYPLLFSDAQIQHLSPSLPRSNSFSVPFIPFKEIPWREKRQNGEHEIIELPFKAMKGNCLK